MTPTPAPLPSIEGWLPILQTVGSLGTLIVAAIALIYAARQVREARRSREEQSRPYVVAFLEADGTILDLVVRNFGATVARNVTMTTDRPMLRKAPSLPDTMEEIPIFSTLPVLVPGQEWRTLFDQGEMRVDAGLDEPYTATLTYEDGSGTRLPEERLVLDWRVYEPVLFRSQKTVDDVAKALDKIAASVKTWTLGNSGLNVYTRSGDEHDRRYREQMEWRRQRFAEQQAQREAELDAMSESGGNEPDPLTLSDSAAPEKDS